MLNFRAPAKIFVSTLHFKAHYCSSGEKADKLINLLPYLQHRKIENIPSTRIVDTHLEGREESDQVECNDDSKIQAPAKAFDDKILTDDTCESPKASLLSAAIPEVPQDPKSLPVLMVTYIKTPTVDLTNTTLPLSLHLEDKESLLVDAVVQDFKHMYFKTSSAIDGWYVVAKAQSKTLYISAEEIMKRPGIVQDFIREQVNKNAVSLYDPKLTAIANIDVNSILEKVKQLIENITTSIKKMFEKETKPSGKEDKKKEEKEGEKKEIK